jgi:hypothetical protein
VHVVTAGVDQQRVGRIDHVAGIQLRRLVFVALVGVQNLVVVDTEDALLVTTREQSQNVGKIVKHLDEKKRHKLT